MEQDIKEQAITGPEFAKNNQLKDYRSLATIGDSLLSFLFLDYIRRLLDIDDMEELNNWKEIIQNNKVLSTIGKVQFRGKTIHMKNNDLKNEKLYANLIEAHVFSLYKKGDLAEAITYVETEFVEILKSTDVEDKITYIYQKKQANGPKGKNWTKLLDDYARFKAKR